MTKGKRVLSKQSLKPNFDEIKASLLDITKGHDFLKNIL